MASILHTAGTILQLNCPKCGKGRVFEKNGDAFLKFPKMHEDCPECHYHFDREPGYFLGAMYASYGLAVFEGICTFLVAKFMVQGLSELTIAFIIAGVIVSLGYWNYKLARVIWMNLFPG